MEGLVNEGMHGKAFRKCLQVKLPSVGVQVPYFFSEDWVWWLQVERIMCRMGL